jgi:hypothetical protein
MILLLIGGHYWCEYISEFSYKREFFSNNINHPKDSQHFKEYIQSIDPVMYRVKLPRYNKDFMGEYSKSLIDISKTYIPMLTHYTDKIDTLLRKYSIFKQYKWHFMMSDNIEKNMPFTLDKTIIIPLVKLKELYSSYQKGIILKEYINTLLHEKIHIVQRFRQTQFDTFYIKKYETFIHSKLDDNLPQSLAEIHMNNPDSNNTIWIYKMDGKQYIPLLVNRDDNIHSIGFNRSLLSDQMQLSLMQSRLGYSTAISFYHPNEIFACDVTEQLILGKLQSDYDMFLSKLS